jgi:hypothetical protein|tara:strand:+ start:636 stop:851 length:216 start_codon:yes stop_codon:yes gene_type:complete
MITDKFHEMVIGFFVLVGGFTTKRIFRNHDTLSDRVSALEKVVLTKEDLNSLERNMEMVVAHLITSKGKND